ncbi:hypothetical protein HID58_095249, partial [Brassica napus]
EPLWWVGLLTMAFGEIANFVAYVYAPAVLVTPLGALSIIISAVLAHFLLNEKLRKMGVWDVFAHRWLRYDRHPCSCSSEHTPNSVDEIWKLAMQPAFLIYVATSMSIVLALILYCEPLCGQTTILVYTGICSSMVFLYVYMRVMSIKAVGIAIKLTLEGINQIWTGMGKHRSMSISSEICGFITVLTGTVILHGTREEEETSSGTLRWQNQGRALTKTSSKLVRS